MSIDNPQENVDEPGGPSPLPRPLLGQSLQSLPPARTPRTPILLFALIILVAMLAAPYLAEQVQFAITRGDQRAKAEIARAELKALPEAVNRFRLVAKAVAPCVVGVKVVQYVGRRGFGDEWSANPLLRAEGEGSGVVVDAAGYILTNYHVIENAAQVQVQLADGRNERNVTVVGADPLTDLAVLKVDDGTLPAAPWGDSDQLEVGDQVIAVGNPYGLTRTVTAGIVSAKDRREATDRGFQEYLQTDAAVNPGNSGGPLVDLRGEVVGINTAIYGRAYQGISFAIPSRLAHEVYNRLRTEGKISRGWLGVAMEEVSESSAKQLGLELPAGVMVAEVVPGSPAQRAGLKRDDVIVRWDGHKVADPMDLSRAVAKTKIGAKVEVGLIRDGKRIARSVAVAERPPQLSR
jgi:serine protease Do